MHAHRWNASYPNISPANIVDSSLSPFNLSQSAHTQLTHDQMRWNDCQQEPPVLSDSGSGRPSCCARITYGRRRTDSGDQKLDALIEADEFCDHVQGRACHRRTHAFRPWTSSRPGELLLFYFSQPRDLNFKAENRSCIASKLLPCIHLFIQFCFLFLFKQKTSKIHNFSSAHPNLANLVSLKSLELVEHVPTVCSQF